MSWADHIQAQLVSRGVSKCGLFGLDGTPWACHGMDGEKVKAQVQAICAAYGTKSSFQGLVESGVHWEGEKYFLTRGDETSAYARKGATGLLLRKTPQCLIVAMHDDKVPSATVSVAVEHFGDFLQSQGH